MYLLLLYRRSRAMASILFSIAYLLFVLLPPALACGKPRPVLYQPQTHVSGGLVHGELAQRGRFLFSLQHDPKAHPAKDEYAARVAHWLQHYDASILAGSFIPDWYSPCSCYIYTQGVPVFGCQRSFRSQYYPASPKLTSSALATVPQSGSGAHPRDISSSRDK